MKKKFGSVILSLLMAFSLAGNAFALQNPGSAESNRTEATIDSVQAFLERKGGRIASAAEMQEISSVLQEISSISTQISANEVRASSLSSALHEAEARLEELPAVSATYEELVDLGFITSRAVDPVPPSPSDTRYVDFVISTTEDVRNGEVYYHTRIYARNDYSSTNDVGAPLYFRNTTDIISESEGTPGFVLDAAKLVLDEVIGGTPEDSIPFFTPTDLLGPSFEEDILTSLSMTTMLSYDFAYDYVASESLPIYYEMLTSERMGFDYFYEYFKRNSNGMVESDTINADDITTETEYYGNTNRAREYVFDLFDEDPFEHELHGFTSVTAELNMYIDGRRVEETYEIGTAYYRSLSSVPGA